MKPVEYDDRRQISISVVVVMTTRCTSAGNGRQVLTQLLFRLTIVNVDVEHDHRLVSVQRFTWP